MIGNKISLDTNIVTAWLKGEVMLADRIDQAEEVFIPIPVLGELYFGAQLSTQVKKNMDNISKLSKY